MHQTPWTKKAASSSLTSDRLRPKPTQTPARPKNPKASEPAPPQSKALRTLHALRSSLQDSSTSTTPDPTGGCFCQARSHPLSPYVPICTTCALPLCDLTAPAHLCPSCSQPLLTPTRRSALIARVDTEIADITLKEQLARERAEHERRAAAGAFPTLSSAPGTAYPSPSPSPKPQAPSQPKATTHKVLSLNSKTKKAVLTTTTTTTRTSATSTPAGSRPASPQPIREPRPDVVDNGKGKAKARVGPVRPWENLSGDGGVYVPSSRVGDDGDAGGEEKVGAGRRRRRNKGKGKEGEDVGSGQGGIGEASGT